jgi:hypothetical protein
MFRTERKCGGTQPNAFHFISYDVGRDGLTHNMLDLIHQHWKRRRVCKIKCKGVPTVDMDNVCNKLEVFIFSFPSVFCVKVGMGFRTKAWE